MSYAPAFSYMPLMPTQLEEVGLRFLVLRETELKSPSQSSHTRIQRAYHKTISNALYFGFSAHAITVAIDMLWHHYDGDLYRLNSALAPYLMSVGCSGEEETNTFVRSDT